MKHVRVRISPGDRAAEIHPMYALWTASDCIERATALQWNFTGNALGILHYAVGDADAFRERVDEIPEVLGYELLETGERTFYVYVRDATTAALAELFGPITEGGLVVVPPIRYHEDGTQTFSLFGPDAEIQAAVESVPAPIDVTIEQVGNLGGLPATVETHLSERQREAVEAALSLGYYDVPREASHEAVAEALDCAPSTAAEHLRKAESRVLHALFGE